MKVKILIGFLAVTLIVLGQSLYTERQSLSVILHGILSYPIATERVLLDSIARYGLRPRFVGSCTVYVWDADDTSKILPTRIECGKDSIGFGDSSGVSPRAWLYYYNREIVANKTFRNLQSFIAGTGAQLGITGKLEIKDSSWIYYAGRYAFKPSSTDGDTIIILQGDSLIRMICDGTTRFFWNLETRRDSGLVAVRESVKIGAGKIYYANDGLCTYDMFRFYGGGQFFSTVYLSSAALNANAFLYAGTMIIKPYTGGVNDTSLFFLDTVAKYGVYNGTRVEAMRLDSASYRTGHLLSDSVYTDSIKSSFAEDTLINTKFTTTTTIALYPISSFATTLGTVSQMPYWNNSTGNGDTIYVRTLAGVTATGKYRWRIVKY